MQQVKELTCDTYKTKCLLKELPRGKAVVQNILLVYICPSMFLSFPSKSRFPLSFHLSVVNLGFKRFPVRLQVLNDVISLKSVFGLYICT